IEGAKTIRVTFTIDAAAEDAVPGQGSLTIEEGGLVKLNATLKSKSGQRISLAEESDGKRVLSSVNNQGVEGIFDAKNGRSNYNVYLSRIGIFTGMFAMHGFRAVAAGRDPSASIDLKQIFQVQNVKVGQSRKGMQGLTYELKSAIEPMPIDLVKIWYDPTTFRIARREYKVKGRGLEETIYEDYLDVQFDGGKGAAAAPKDKPAPPAPIPDAEVENLFFKAKLQVAESHLRAGKKDKAAEILEEIIKTYPKHPQIGDARRLLEDAKKK
ncbi:MAG: hypothetical protein HY293_06160, partial [Planctomycetes bacterium]|nr:hypothetical protein [Planctomycetota bacterium]